MKKYFTYLTILVFVLMASAPIFYVRAQDCLNFPTDPACDTSNGGSGTGAGNGGSGTGAGNGGSGTSAAGSNIDSHLQNPFGNTGANNIPELFQTIINNIIIPIGAVLAILAFIYAGFLYVTAAGDEKKIGIAHKALLYAAVGTAVLLGAGVIAQVIRATINQLQ